MVVGIPGEAAPERRAAITPEVVERLIGLGFTVRVAAGVGLGFSAEDEDFRKAGAEVVDTATAWAAEVVLHVHPPSMDEVRLLSPGALLICLVWPARQAELLQHLADAGVTTFALDLVPRISRAQKFDVLSSMANLAGYRAVVEAAAALGAPLGGQITAAGRCRPARVLVIGAGVAGLAAIAAARGLGAEVRAFDVRSACREQVESLGATFLPLVLPEEGESAGGYAKEASARLLEAEHALFLAQAPETDVLITTALVPGRPAPKLVPPQVLEALRPGAVVVDLAAEQGGNVEGTVPGQSVRLGRAVVLGYTDLVARLPRQASQFFASNLAHLLEDLGGAQLDLKPDDLVVQQAVVTRKRRVVWPPPPLPPAPAPVAAPGPVVTPAAALPPAPAARSSHGGHGAASRGGVNGPLGLGVALALTTVASFAPSDFVQHLTVFVLACFVGWQLIWSVAPALHTPLMSVTNAISGIIVVGGLLEAGRGGIGVGTLLGALAVLVATINIAGGFLVTERMLRMFRKEG